MMMAGLKLRSMAGSVHIKPYNTSASGSPPISIATINPTSTSLSLSSTTPTFQFPPLTYKSGGSNLSPLFSTNPTSLGLRATTGCFTSSASASGVGSDMGSEHSGNNSFSRHNSLPPMKNQHHRPSSESKLLTLPTILTLGRVASVPILIGTFYVDGWWGTTATTSIFIAAAITDWLDGYLARKMRLGSAFGAFLDPVADKLMVATTLVLLCTKPLEVDMFGQAPWLLTIPSVAIIGREITMSAVREWAASQNSKVMEAVAVNSLGKWKTATQMTALTILLATRDSSLGGPGFLVNSGVALLYISAWLAVWSLVVYVKKIGKVLLK